MHIAIDTPDKAVNRRRAMGGIVPRVAGMRAGMPDPPELDCATPEPRKRPQFLEKLNPKATRRSIMRSAILHGLGAAVVWSLLMVVRLNPNWHPDSWRFLMWIGVAAVVGAVWEWQPIDL